MDPGPEERQWKRQLGESQDSNEHCIDVKFIVSISVYGMYYDYIVQRFRGSWVKGIWGYFVQCFHESETISQLHIS